MKSVDPFAIAERNEPWGVRVVRTGAVVAAHLALLAWLGQQQFVAGEESPLTALDVWTIEEKVETPPKPMPPPKPVRVREPETMPILTSNEPNDATPAFTVPPQPPTPSVEPPPPAPPPPAIVAVAAPVPLIGARFDADYLQNPAPQYPFASRRMKEEGTVLLYVRVSAAGTAEQVDVRKSSGYARLDDAALAAVEHWRFVPARRGDEPVAASVIVPIVFRIES